MKFAATNEYLNVCVLRSGRSSVYCDRLNVFGSKMYIELFTYTYICVYKLLNFVYTF